MHKLAQIYKTVSHYLPSYLQSYLQYPQVLPLVKHQRKVSPDMVQLSWVPEASVKGNVQGWSAVLPVTVTQAVDMEKEMLGEF
jgi:hypothetical protein